jgi:hypothetical protein
VEDEAVVVHPQDNRVYVLNPAAAAAWGLADGTHTCRQIAEVLAGRYSANVEQVAADLDTLWAELAQRGLLLEQEAAAATPAGQGTASWPLPPTGSDYTPPRIESEEALEVLAAVCSSARGSASLSVCRTFGACQVAFN